MHSGTHSFRGEDCTAALEALANRPCYLLGWDAAAGSGYVAELLLLVGGPEFDLDVECGAG